MNFSIPDFVNFKASKVIENTIGLSPPSVRISAEHPSFVVGSDGLLGGTTAELSGKLNLQ